MEILGYSAAVIIGLSLGMIGGGGSILTVPVLVYLFHINPATATSYSLFIVGITSLFGAYTNFRKQQVSIVTALLFGTASVITTLVIRRWVVPAIPVILFETGKFAITKSFAMMAGFALLMIIASVSMIRPCRKCEEIQTNVQPEYGRLFLFGVLIGIVTGLLGAGGGFLLIPALILFLKMPMKKAVGTSLLIIALNSLIGFTGDIGNYTIDWALLAILTVLAISGILIGSFVSQGINGNKLKKGFGFFVMIMGIYIITNELLRSGL
ncbi:MAG: permease [Bacteroidetes bacterium]|nr:MAG: permease [Bacteroidota bacterium]